MPLVSKAQVLGLVRPTVDVNVTELGPDACVRLKLMTGEQRDRWDSALAKKADKEFGGLRSLLVSMCAVDENDKTVFSPKELDGIHAGVLDKLFDAAFELNKLGAKAPEEAAKNLPSEKSSKFWFFLARTVLHCTVKEAQQRMDSAEFTYWMGYFGIEPWGEEWLQTGNICSMIYDSNRGKNSKRLVPDDWVFRPYKKRSGQTAEQMRAVMIQMRTGMELSGVGFSK